MGGDTGEGRFSQGSSSSLVQILSLPTTQLVPHVVKYKLEVPRVWFFVKDGVPKVFTKRGAGLNAKGVTAFLSLLSGAILREDNSRFSMVDPLTR